MITTPALMRVLKPKITPAAALRMHAQYVTGIAVTTSTMSMLWWTAYWTTWSAVMFPEGQK